MNQNKFTQPHVRAKLERSGALETVEMANARTNVAKTLETLTRSATAILMDAGRYVEGDDLARLSILAMRCDERTVATFGRKSPYRLKATRLMELVRQASRLIGLIQVQIAAGLPPVSSIIFRTRGQVNLIFAGIGC